MSIFMTCEIDFGLFCIINQLGLSPSDLLCGLNHQVD